MNPALVGSNLMIVRPARRALEVLRDEIVSDLNLKNLVIDYYYGKTQLSDNLHDAILAKETNQARNRAFLEVVLQSNTTDVFIEALEYDNTHTDLAQRIKTLIQEMTSSNILVQPRRINTNCSMMRKRIKFNFKLREITSQGKQCERLLLRITSYMKRKFKQDMDIQFHMLDARIAFYRVFYKQEGYEQQEALLNEMELIVQRTKHPPLSQMVYLARKGSFLASKGNIELGFQYLERAKTLSAQIQPCKETGAVRFIETNMLLQVFNKRPDQDTKQNIIESINHAVTYDFAEVDPEVREDYTKMMKLKLAFCVLGIGCFCEIIPACMIGEDDHKMAKDCFKFIDDLPGQLYNKHLMFYNFAQSVQTLALNNKSEALQQAMKAHFMASTSGFQKEKENIKLYLNNICGVGIQEQNVNIV